MAINVQTLQGRWNELKGEVKKRWAHLTDDDLQWGDGNIDQLIGKIQERTGESREVIEKYLNYLTQEGAEGVSGAVESVGQAASHAANRLREGYSQFADQAGEQYSQLADKASEQYGQAREMVVHNPVQWVLGAFGIGFLAGMIAGYAGGAKQNQSMARRYFG